MSTPADRLAKRAATLATKQAERASRQSDRRTNHQVLGAVLLAVGGNWLLAELGLFPFGWPGLIAVGLMTLGVALIGTAKAGRTKPMVAIGILMTVVLAMSSGVGGAVGGGFEDGTYVVRSQAELLDLYERRLGDLTLDLRNLDLDESDHVSGVTRVGDVRVILPRDLAVSVTAEVHGPGEIDILGTKDDGIRTTMTYESPGFQGAGDRLALRLETTVGEIKVERR